MAGKVQFNVYLEPKLIAAIKHRAIDEQLSLSDLVAKLIGNYIKESTMSDSDSSLKLQPMVHVEEMAASILFYEALGGAMVAGSRDGDWALISVGGGEISLLAHPPNPEQNEGLVELNFESDGPLDAVQARLEAGAVKIVRGAADEAFGAQLQVEAPGGLLVKINQIDKEAIG